MKCVFLTNQASYHQMHFARAMAAELGEENFRIVFEKNTSAARAEMGWGDDYSDPFIIRLFESRSAQDECRQWIADADIVIQGRFPIGYVRQRIKAGKLTFACQERLWKKPPSWKRKLSRIAHLYKNYYSVNVPNYHFLAIGSYAAKDLNDMGIFVDRSWTYGYFIDCDTVSAKPSNSPLRLLWCARFSEVKQPHKALEILEGLLSNGMSVHLTMIGDGDLREGFEQKAADRGLSDQITFTGWQSQDQVFDHMAASDVFLMTSHQGEGWGLVVNEALSHGCAVVANRELGAAACLIQHAENGLLYQDSDISSVVESLSELGEDRIRSLGKTAQRRMRDDWSATQAAQRTIELSKELLRGNIKSAQTLYPRGICSFVK